MGWTWTFSKSIPFPPMSMTIFCPSPVLSIQSGQQSIRTIRKRIAVVEISIADHRSYRAKEMSGSPVITVGGGEMHEIRSVLVEETVAREIGSVTTYRHTVSSRTASTKTNEEN